MVADVLGSSLKHLCEMTPDRDHQDSRYWLNSNSIKAFGWEQKVSWSDGLLRVKRWVWDNLDDLKTMPTDFVMRP
jgi:dTDP-D-glucose 4,6-dehydratase